jgi:glyoxylase-like metal-dependent hydrolase (beta-lactamase superfamily II)
MGSVAVRDTEPIELAPGVWRAGSEFVNWYLVEEGGRVTIVDAGLPGYRPQLDRALDRMARGTGDVAALILTRAHVDHVGIAEPVRAELGVAVHVHADDEQLARTKKPVGKNERSSLPYLRYPFVYRLLWHMIRAGVAKTKAIAEVTTFSDGETLDVPGRPRVVHTPGHTSGHCAFHLAEKGALLVGDEICTLNPATGRRGPQLMPRALNLSSATCLDSLARIQDLEADVVLPGHGEPWLDGVPAVVEQARAAGAV